MFKQAQYILIIFKTGLHFKTRQTYELKNNTQYTGKKRMLFSLLKSESG